MFAYAYMIMILKNPFCAK